MGREAVDPVHAQAGGHRPGCIPGVGRLEGELCRLDAELGGRESVDAASGLKAPTRSTERTSSSSGASPAPARNRSSVWGEPFERTAQGIPRTRSSRRQGSASGCAPRPAGIKKRAKSSVVKPERRQRRVESPTRTARDLARARPRRTRPARRRRTDRPLPLTRRAGLAAPGRPAPSGRPRPPRAPRQPAKRGHPLARDLPLRPSRRPVTPNAPLHQRRQPDRLQRQRPLLPGRRRPRLRRSPPDPGRPDLGRRPPECRRRLRPLAERPRLVPRPNRAPERLPRREWPGP